MRKARLSKKWKRFRIERKQALLAAGVPHAIAERLAADEARGRAHVESYLGERAALEGDFVTLVAEDGRARAFLTGANELLPDDNTRELAAAITEQTLGAPTLH